MLKAVSQVVVVCLFVLQIFKFFQADDSDWLLI